jgi:hypothetical protein
MVLKPVLLQGPLMRLQMEAYLDDNPEFTESYVIRKVGRKTIEKWLQLHTGQSTIKENLILFFHGHEKNKYLRRMFRSF